MTTPESTKVICRTPQPSNVRATEQPRVPAPSSKHFCAAMVSVCSCGIRRLVRGRARVRATARARARARVRAGAGARPGATARATVSARSTIASGGG